MQSMDQARRMAGLSRRALLSWMTVFSIATILVNQPTFFHPFDETHPHYYYYYYNHRMDATTRSSSSQPVSVKHPRLSISSLSNSSSHQPKTTAATKGPMFLFVVGLESTGHHLFSTIYKGSPARQRMIDLKLRDLVRDVQLLLYSNAGLMNLHCLSQGPVKYEVSRSAAVRKCPPSDSVCLYQQIIQKMRAIAKKLGDEQLPIPINANGNIVSMASYPNNRHPCRSLEYPILEFYYQACKEANVECKQLYLYRDPYDIVSSSQKRNYNVSPLQAMQLYTTMLHVTHSQMQTHPDRSYGCIGFFDTHLANETKWGTIRDVLGWSSNHTAFRSFVDSVYRAPTPSNITKTVVSSKDSMYMMPFVTAHENVLRLCHDQAKASKGSLM